MRHSFRDRAGTAEAGTARRHVDIDSGCRSSPVSRQACNRPQATNMEQGVDRSGSPCLAGQVPHLRWRLLAAHER